MPPVYNAVSGDLGGFRERIAPGAFADVLDADVRALLNHNPSEVLGRTKSGTMRLFDEQRGLRFEIDVPDSPLGESVKAAVKRGDIDGASFRFQVGEESWDGDLRTVKSVKSLHDITVATYPAYPDSSVELRSGPTMPPEQEQTSCLTKQCKRSAPLRQLPRRPRSDPRSRLYASPSECSQSRTALAARSSRRSPMHTPSAGSSRTARRALAGMSSGRSRGRLGLSSPT